MIPFAEYLFSLSVLFCLINIYTYIKRKPFCLFVLVVAGRRRRHGA